jgi:DNA-binding NarL/FixJ family response regulator
MKENILIVDDQEDVLEVVKDAILESGLAANIYTASGPIPALDIYFQQKDSLSIIICDQFMPGTNGVDFLGIINKNSPWMHFILYTGDLNFNRQTQKIPDHIRDIVYKNSPLSHLIKLIRESSQSHTLAPVSEATAASAKLSNLRKYPRYAAESLYSCYLQIDKSGKTILQPCVLLTQSRGGVSLTTKLSALFEKSAVCDLWMGKMAIDSSNVEFLALGPVSHRRAKIAWVEIISVDVLKVGLEFITALPLDSDRPTASA